MVEDAGEYRIAFKAVEILGKSGTGSGNDHLAGQRGEKDAASHIGTCGQWEDHMGAPLLQKAAGAGTTEGHPRAILIVPEQYSFESERAILRGMGAEKAQGILVTSFTRLAELSFRTYGGLPGGG